MFWGRGRRDFRSQPVCVSALVLNVTFVYCSNNLTFRCYRVTVGGSTGLQRPSVRHDEVHLWENTWLSVPGNIHCNQNKRTSEMESWKTKDLCAAFTKMIPERWTEVVWIRLHCINLFSSHRLRLLPVGAVLIRAGRTCVQTPGGWVGVGRPALCCLAFPTLRPVWRWMVERRQRAISHQKP